MNININHLAKLGRLEINEEEKLALERELESILSYVSEIKEAGDTAEGTAESTAEGNLLLAEGYLRRATLQNIFREDIDPYPSGDFTKELMAGAPRAEEGYLVVKQIIGQK